MIEILLLSTATETTVPNWTSGFLKSWPKLEGKKVVSDIYYLMNSI